MIAKWKTQQQCLCMSVGFWVFSLFPLEISGPVHPLQCSSGAQRWSGFESSNGSLVSAALAVAQLASIVRPQTHCGSYTTTPKCYIVKGQMLFSATTLPVCPHYMCAVHNLKVSLYRALQPNTQSAKCSLGLSWMLVVACVHGCVV